MRRMGSQHEKQVQLSGEAGASRMRGTENKIVCESNCAPYISYRGTTSNTATFKSKIRPKVPHDNPYQTGQE